MTLLFSTELEIYNVSKGTFLFIKLSNSEGYRYRWSLNGPWTSIPGISEEFLIAQGFKGKAIEEIQTRASRLINDSIEFR